MSDRDHYQHNYHGRGGGPNRDSPASNASSSTRRSATLNGGGKNVGGSSNNRNSSPASQGGGGGGVSGLADDLSHLNLPNEVSVGSVVQCSVANRTYKGEVMAFDPVVKAIVLSKFRNSCDMLPDALVTRF